MSKTATRSTKRLIDLCCKAGGTSTGYHRAGFEVVGVDIEPQPNYPFEFIQADILDVLADQSFMATFDAVAGSPTCQTFANVTNWRGNQDDYPDLLTPTLAALKDLGMPYIVENVPEAALYGPLRQDYLLCGTQFGLRVKRHRAIQVGYWQPAFELLPPHHCYRNRELVPFGHKDEKAFRNAMDCTWMTNIEGRQAIPPAYTEYLGTALMNSLNLVAAA